MSTTLRLLRKKRLWFGLAVVSCLIVLISQLPIGLWLALMKAWLSGQGIWAIPTFITLYVAAAVFGLPNIVLILAAGPLFGLAQGVISASIADTLSIAACFVIGQTVGRRWITGTVRENSRFHKLDSAFAKKGWKIVLLTRLSPVLPSNILNYGFSLTRINFTEYLFFSWLGMLPVIFTYVYVGTFGANILAPGQQENLIVQAIGLAATLGVMVYATTLAASALKDDESEQADYAQRQPLTGRQRQEPQKQQARSYQQVLGARVQRVYGSYRAVNQDALRRQISARRPSAKRQEGVKLPALDKDQRLRRVSIHR